MLLKLLPHIPRASELANGMALTLSLGPDHFQFHWHARLDFVNKNEQGVQKI